MSFSLPQLAGGDQSG